MRKEHSKLIEKVVASLDWDSIFEVYKAFKMGIGEGSTVIPGIKRKPFSESLTKNDIKGELKVLLKQVIDGDLSDVMYGPWIITWENGDWEYEIEDGEENEIESEEQISDDNIVNSRLEVIYAPQRIALIINSIKQEEGEIEEEEDAIVIESLMQKAIKNEDYELASKFRDILKHQNKDHKLDT